MTSLKPTIVALVLQRDGISQPWGFRLSGGCDVDHPLIVTKVMLGTPSDGVLQTGDLIRKIGNYDARDLNHKDALSLFKNSGGSISVAVERMLPVERRQESRNTLSFIPQPPIPGAVATPFTVAGISKYERKRPIRNNYCVFPPELLKASSADSQYSMMSSHSEETHSVTEEFWLPMRDYIRRTMNLYACTADSVLIWPCTYRKSKENTVQYGRPKS